MKNFKILLFLIFLISTLAQGQTTPPIKLRSTGAFTQVDYFLNVKKRFGIPFSPINNLVCNDSYPLMFNTTEGKLKLYNGTSWINPFSLNLQEVTTFGNTTTNNIIISTDSGPEKTIIKAGSLDLIKNSLSGDKAVLRADNITGGEKVFQFPNIAGTLLTDAPSDGTGYIRKNGIWEANAGGGTPTLQEVLDYSREWIGTNGLDKVSFNPTGGVGEMSHTMYEGGYNNGTGSSQTSNRFWINSYDSSNNIITEIKANRQSVLLGQTNFGPYSGLRIVGDEGIIFESGGTNDGTQVALNSANITGNRNQQFTDASGNISIINTTAPASSTAAGKVGEIRVTSAYIYVCTATNTWVRSAVATW